MGTEIRCFGVSTIARDKGPHRRILILPTLRTIFPDGANRSPSNVRATSSHPLIGRDANHGILILQPAEKHVIDVTT